VRQLLSTWPIPFPSLEAAEAFFGGGTLAGRTWTGSLEAHDGGLWPAFEIDVMIATLEEATGAGYWDEWRSIRAPILVVRAENGDLSASEAEEMVETSADATLVSVAGAGHDVHLDAPDAWRRAVEDFLSRLS
jgi:pimeloyl-ACP methyl ester carboxylesterase